MIIHEHKIDKDHTDSFWYEGLIAETENFELRAVGDIEFNGKEPENDSDIAKMYENNQFYLNNWFEIIEKGDELMCGNDIDGDYDSAIKTLKMVQEDFDLERKQ